MTFEQIEAEILALPKDSLALLVARIIEHLGQVEQIDQQIADEWAEEAERRDQDMSDGNVAGIPSQEVFKRIRASLQ
ncbi:MAG TPA: addiction module protein [Nostocaceae cyanobacterium]|nr:addiction module protein [Nostocaceae cyanobacterium]